MRISSFIVAASASSTLALTIPTGENVKNRESRAEDLFTIETAPGETREVTEAQKWKLHNVSFPAIILPSSPLNA
jgi:leucyl aminopeptidase